MTKSAPVRGNLKELLQIIWDWFLPSGEDIVPEAKKELKSFLIKVRQKQIEEMVKKVKKIDETGAVKGKLGVVVRTPNYGLIPKEEVIEIIEKS